MTNRYTKVSKATTTLKITSTQVANMFFNDRKIPCKIADTVLSGNGQEFTSKFFKSLSSYLATTKVTTTAFHPQTNCQVGIFSKTPISRVQSYIADNQKKWNIFVALLAYAHTYHIFLNNSRLLTRSTNLSSQQNSPCFSFKFELSIILNVFVRWLSQKRGTHCYL